MTTPTVSMRAFLTDRRFLGSTFGRKSFARARCIMIAAYGEPLNEEEAALFEEVTGLPPPTEPCKDIALVCGRRAGKDEICSAITCYECCVKSWPMLSRGEVGRWIVMAFDRSQAIEQKNRISGMLQSSPALRGLVANETALSIALTNGLVIDVRANSAKRLRGVTAIGITCSEIGHWWSDELSANPDLEVLRATRPTMLTTGGRMLFSSTPYLRSGEFFKIFEQYYGKPGSTLVVHATTEQMNPIVDKSELEAERIKDEANYRAEYLAQWRADLASFIDPAAVQRVTLAGIVDREPVPGVQYTLFADPSGGSSDSFTWSVAYIDEAGVVHIVCTGEVKAPFSPSEVCVTVAKDAERYGCKKVYADRYASGFASDAFEAVGLTLEHSALNKSQLYIELLSMVNSGSIAIPDFERGRRQLLALQRRAGQGGRESIDHPKNGKDDIVNAWAGVAYYCKETRKHSWGFGVCVGNRLDGQGRELRAANEHAWDTRQYREEQKKPKRARFNPRGCTTGNGSHETGALGAKQNRSATVAEAPDHHRRANRARRV
jgi:hypothetical protein